MTQPSFIPKPWASGSSAQSGTIPETTTQASSGYASWDLGFPPSTALAMDAGGVPPRYLDFQGVLKAISQHICFQQAGATYTWSNTLDYPLGAIVLGSDNKLYIAIQASTVASAKDPTTETAYWKKLDVDASISTHNSDTAAHSYIRGLVTTAQSTADSASTTANAALPKSGGTMTGALTMGTNAVNMGGADLSAVSSVLSYAGKTVERVSESGTGYVRYESGLQICWGDKTLSYNTVTTITLPAAFKDTSYIIANASKHMSSSTIFSVPSTITSFPYTTSSFYLGQVNTASATMDVQWIAIGPWK